MEESRFEHLLLAVGCSIRNPQFEIRNAVFVILSNLFHIYPVRSLLSNGVNSGRISLFQYLISPFRKGEKEGFD